MGGLSLGRSHSGRVALTGAELARLSHLGPLDPNLRHGSTTGRRLSRPGYSQVASLQLALPLYRPLLRSLWPNLPSTSTSPTPPPPPTSYIAQMTWQVLTV